MAIVIFCLMLIHIVTLIIVEIREEDWGRRRHRVPIRPPKPEARCRTGAGDLAAGHFTSPKPPAIRPANRAGARRGGVAQCRFRHHSNQASKGE